MMNTCVSINCPFISNCNKYNFLIDRGSGCQVQEEILQKAMNNKIKRIWNSIEGFEESVAAGISEYEEGYMDGCHDAYIDVLDILKIEHNFKKYERGIV